MVLLYEAFYGSFALVGVPLDPSFRFPVEFQHYSCIPFAGSDHSPPTPLRNSFFRCDVIVVLLVRIGLQFFPFSFPSKHGEGLSVVEDGPTFSIFALHRAT